MTKKLLSVLLIFSVCMAFSCCNRENRFSFPELIRRVEDGFDCTELSLENAFFSDGEWFLFVSACGENDMLITAKENEQSKFLESVSVSVTEMGYDGQKEAYIKLIEAVASAFIFDADIKKLLEGVKLYEDSAVFSEDTYFYEEGRFSLSFFNADIGSAMLIEIV